MRNIVKIFFFFFATMYAALSILSGFNYDSPVLFSMLLMGCNIYCLYNVRSHICLAIIMGFLFYFNYSIVMVNYITHYTVSEYVMSEIHGMTMKQGLNALYCFNYLMLFCLPKKINKIKYVNNNVIRCEFHVLIKIVLFVLLCYILMTQFIPPTGVGERGKSTPLYEYSIIFSIIAALTAKTKLWKFLFSGLFVGFMIQEVIYGGRIVALQYLLLIYLVYFSEKFQLKKVIPIVITVLILFTFVGMVRGSLLQANFSFASIIDKLKGEMFALDTAYSAFYTSLMGIDVADSIPMEKRLEVFYVFVKSIFLGESHNMNMSISHFVYKYHWHSFGYVLPLAFHFYLGIFGVAVPAFVLKFYYKIINNMSTSKFRLVIGLYLTIAMPRWYLYSPINLFRGVAILIIVFFIIENANSILIRRRISNRWYEKNVQKK